MCSKLFMDSNLDLLLSDGSENPLTNEEITTLISALEKDRNNKEAVNSLITHNIRYIYSFSKNNFFVEKDDAFISSIEGFINYLQQANMKDISYWAAKLNTDYSHAILFLSKNHISDSLKKETLNNQHVVFTEYELKNIKKTRAALAKVEEELGSSIDKAEKLKEVSNRTKLSVKQVENCLKSSMAPLSIYKTTKDDDGDEYCLLDTLEVSNNLNPENIFIEASMKNDIRKAIDGLSVLQKDFIIRFYGFENNEKKSVEEISKLHGVSRQWGNHILKTALSKLRNSKEDLEFYYLAS